MRIQNQNSSVDLSDVPTLFLPSLMRRDHPGAPISVISDKHIPDVSFMFHGNFVLTMHFILLLLKSYLNLTGFSCASCG